MGMFNYLSFEHKRPRCGAEMLMEAEIKLDIVGVDEKGGDIFYERLF